MKKDVDNLGEKSGEKLPPEMGERLLEFKAYLQLELGRSKNTVLSYVADVEAFGKFMAQNGASSFCDADSDSVVNWICASKSTAASSQARRISSVKCFGIYMCDLGLWEKNYADNAARPKMRRKVPQVLSPTEIGALITASGDDSFEAVRDAAMMELMYGSGLRVSEICSLKASDVDLNEGLLRVRGKGSKTRIVPMGEMSIRAIEKYIANLRLIKNNKAPELFISKRLKKISRKTFWYNLKKYAAKVGLQKPVKPHGLRHSFATHLLQNGANLMSIREMLGHADLSTTQIYTQLLTEDVKRQHDTKHPRSKMPFGHAHGAGSI